MDARIELRYDHRSLIEEKWIKKSEEGRWYSWERTLLLKTEDEKVTVIALNIFKRILCAFYQFFGLNYFKDLLGDRKFEILDPTSIIQLKKKNSENLQQKAVEVIEKITIRPEDYTAIKDEIAIPLAFQSLDQLIEKINRRVGYGVVRWKYDPNQVGIRTRLVRELKERGYIYDFCSSLGNPQKYEIFATQKDLEAYEKYQSEENQEEIHLFQKANQVTLAEHDLAAIKHEIAFIEGFEHLYRLVEKMNSRTGHGILKWKYDPANIRTRNVILRELKARGYIYHYSENNENPKKYEIFVKAEDLAVFERSKLERPPQ